jgi:hypothetical protein
MADAPIESMPVRILKSIQPAQSVLPQTELEFSFVGVSITRSEEGFYGHSQERIELAGV